MIPLSLFSRILGDAVLLILAVDVIARLIDDTRARWRTRRAAHAMLRDLDAYSRAHHDGPEGPR